MTLYRQLMLLILTLVILSMLGTLYVTFIHTKAYYTEQLNISAQDTATSLGLSLSSHISDKATMLSMVNAIFDRGYFSRIEIKGNDGKTLIEKIQQPNYHTLPHWFVYLVDFPSPERNALIMSGWKQKGTLLVTANPSLAYFDLWNTSKSLVKWFFILTFFFLTFAYVVTKILFAPLMRVARQAHEICKNIFHVESKIPKTQELRLVTEAMNKTVLKLKAIFKEQSLELNRMRKKNHQDSLTQLGNRSFFDSKLKTLLTDESTFEAGYLLFIEISDLKVFNETHGLQKGDELVKTVADIIQAHCQQVSYYCTARTTGSNFAVVILNVSKEEITDFATNLLQDVKQQLLSMDNQLSANIGGCDYNYQQSPSKLLSNTDCALIQAKHQGSFNVCIENLEHSSQTESLSDWKQCLLDALSTHAIILNQQTIQNQEQGNYHKEVFVRLKTKDNELSAGQFIPIAEKLKLAHKIDLYVVEAVSQLPENHCPYAINLSSDTIYEAAHRQSFISKLNQLKNRNIHFEIAESIVEKDLNICKKFIESLYGLGFTIGLDRVGGHFSTLLYLSSLKVSYIKMDSSYIQEIETNQANQTMVKLLKNATDSLDIILIGTNIESTNEWRTLTKLGVKWGQGNLIDSVKKI